MNFNILKKLFCMILLLTILVNQPLVCNSDSNMLQEQNNSYFANIGKNDSLKENRSNSKSLNQIMEIIIWPFLFVGIPLGVYLGKRWGDNGAKCC